MALADEMNPGIRFSSSQEGFQDRDPSESWQSSLWVGQWARWHGFPQYYQ